MNDLSLNTLKQRLDRLERQHRWWKIMGGLPAALLGLAVLIAATSATVPNEVRAKKFVLIDAGGKIAAQLLVDADKPVLDLYDNKQRDRTSVYPTGWIVVSGDNTPDKTVKAVLNPNGLTLSDLGGSVHLYGVGLLAIEGGPGVLPFLKVSTKDGKVIWKAP